MTREGDFSLLFFYKLGVWFRNNVIFLKPQTINLKQKKHELPRYN